MTINNTNFSNHDQYIKEHRQDVKNAFEWLKLAVLPSLVDEKKIEEVKRLVTFHDLSKYSTKEFFAYNDYFFGDSKGKNKKEFSNAWIHHIHNNPHHWEHWVIYDNGNSTAADMPIEYIIEMICDWWSFSWRKNDLFEIFTWYDEHKEDFYLSTKTKSTIEEILQTLRFQLEECSQEELAVE